MRGLSRKESINLYEQALKDNDKDTIRLLCRTDLFFLLCIICRRRDANNDWVYERCVEIEQDPYGYLDLWAREHYKSSIKTFALPIQEILCSHGLNPIKWKNEVTIGIFSHTRPIAKKFLEQIKNEFENNQLLKDLFPDILYQNPQREAPKWSLDGGIVVKRKSNPKESTIEGWGLIDGQPTGSHFWIRIYDDVVSRESCTTVEQVKKAINAWETSLNLGITDGGVESYAGTRWAFNDPYKEIMEREAVVPRIYGPTKNGKMDGIPVMWTKEQLYDKRKKMGPYVASCQLFQNPKEDSAMGFSQEWLCFYDNIPSLSDWNLYLLCDPANEKKKINDYTVMLVIGLAPDGNYYLIDGLRDRLNLTERTAKLFELHARYKPIKTGYEKYGMQCDIYHIEYERDIRNYRFDVLPLGGGISKEVRILGTDQVQGLVPIFEQKRFWLPHKLLFIDHEKKVRDLVNEFIKDEYLAYPFAIKHEDILDCMARITDPALKAVFPMIEENRFNVTIPKIQETVTTNYDLFA